MRTKQITRSLSAVTLALAVAASSTMTASAAPAPEEKIAGLIERVAPDQGKVVAPKAAAKTPGHYRAASPAPIEVPADGGASLKIEMPSNVNVGEGKVASDGTVVYPSKNGGADVAIQTMDDGAVRAQTVINASDAAHEFGYDVGDAYQPVQDANGDFWVVGFDEAGEFQAFSVEDAWAKDAAGKDVPTRYEIRGTELVQVVTPGPDAVYPIVADPTWQWYQFAYGAGLSKAETRNVAAAGGVTAFCALLPGAFAVACGVSGGYWYLQASLAVNANGCVFYAVVPAPVAMRWLSPECR